MRRAFTVMLLSLSLVVAGAACSKKSDSSKSDKKTDKEASSTKKNDEKFSGNSSSKYCDFSRAAEEVTAEDATTPAEVLEQLAETEQLMEDSADMTIPDEIESDFRIYEAAYVKAARALKDAGEDFTRIYPAVSASMESPEVAAANKRLEKYDEEVCGIKPDS